MLTTAASFVRCCCKALSMFIDFQLQGFNLAPAGDNNDIGGVHKDIFYFAIRFAVGQNFAAIIQLPYFAGIIAGHCPASCGCT